MPAIPAGQKIDLNLQLYEGDASQFPQARLYDENGTELGASPVDLAHVGNGKYTDDSVTMPSARAVHVTYIVYEDAGHTVESLFFTRGSDLFLKDAIADAVSAAIRPVDIQAKVEEPGEELEGIVASGEEITGIVKDC